MYRLQRDSVVASSVTGHPTASSEAAFALLCYLSCYLSLSLFLSLSLHLALSSILTPLYHLIFSL
jgi:hypothetical protein